MQLLLEIDNPSKLKILTDLLHELKFVSNIKVIDLKKDAVETRISREQSLAKIMQGSELLSFGDGLDFQKEVRTDRILPFREH